MKLVKAIIVRAYRTVIQSAIGAAATAALTAIGSATTLGEVHWGHVASTAGLAAVVCVLMSLKGLPEAGDDNE